MASQSDAAPLDLNFRITTPRLELRYLNPASDAQCDFMVELVNSPEFLAANGGTSTPTPDRATARRLLEADTPQLAKTGYGRYIVSIKQDLSADSSKTNQGSSETFIGTVAMKLRRNEGAPTVPDIGFQFLRRFWGKGYATEATNALLVYFEKEKGVSEFAGYCTPENEQSKKMFQRLGFDYRGERPLKLSQNGDVIADLVWTKGLKQDLEAYRL